MEIFYSFCQGNQKARHHIYMIIIFYLSNVIRLVDEGRLEALNGDWGTLCDDNFSTNDAQVACKILSYHKRYT